MATLIVLVLILLLLFTLFIRRGVNLNARDVLSNYLNTTVSGRTEEAYHYLSSKNKANHTLQEYRTGQTLGSGLMANMIARNISFAFEKMDVLGNKATAVVTITAPDFKLMMSDVFQEMAPDRIPEQNLEAFIFVCREISHYLDKYQQDAIPMKTCTEAFHLIREEGSWKICLED